MSDTQKSDNCISGFSILRATMMAVLFPAVLVYYYDAVFWKPYFYGPWNTPTLWSFLAMAAGGLAAAVHRFLRRRKGRPLPRPGIEEIWLTLAAGALSAHSMAKTPGLLNIRYIGFPPGLEIIYALLQTAATYVFLGRAGRNNRTLTCAVSTTAVLLARNRWTSSTSRT